MSTTPIDVKALPDHAFGPRGLIWWGTVGFMVIEGSMFAMVLLTYFVLRTRVTEWPPSLPDPDPTLATVNSVVLLLSLIPNMMAKHAGEQFDLARVRRHLTALIGCGLVFVVIRAFEFGALGCTWDDNAYASIVWAIMGLHTLHVLTDVVDSMVLLAVLWRERVEPRRFVDVSENSLYWNFVVASWFPVYLTVYFGARWL